MEKLTTKVDRERWHRAQAWELGFWRSRHDAPAGGIIRILKSLAKRVLGRSPEPAFHEGDDSNHWWLARFDGYSMVPKELDAVLELGCGPYTNVRLIREGRTVKRICCSDPLAAQYLELKGQWLSRAFKRGEIEIDTTPAEQCPFPNDTFDLVVMINVLDHVFDAEACVRQAIRVLRVGGTIVIGQELTNEEDLLKLPEEFKRHGMTEDTGHPIRFGHEFLEGILLGPTEPVLHRVLPRDEGRAPNAHYGTFLYAGTKVA